MPDSQSNKSSRRTQVSIIIFILAVLAAAGYLYVYMKHTAALRAAEHKYTFSEYVSDHKLGKLALIDTGTGIDPTTYVLQTVTLSSGNLEQINKHVDW